MYEKQLVGSIFGSANPRRDIPRLLRLYQEGQLKLDELVTTTYPIEDINLGYQDMRDGNNIRGMVIYDHAQRQLTSAPPVSGRPPLCVSAQSGGRSVH